MSLNPRTWLSWLPALAWAGFLFTMSHQQVTPDPGPWFLGNDKLNHALAYAVLALLLFAALRFGLDWTPRGAALLAFVLASLYGVSDEVHQSFVPTRVTELNDWLADAAGAALATGAAWLVTRMRIARPAATARISP